MNFYRLIEQQYDDYIKQRYNVQKAGKYPKISCKVCPCRTLRYKVFGEKKTNNCRREMEQIVNKYNVYDVNIFFCDDCRRISVEIAKKIFGKEFNKI